MGCLRFGCAFIGTLFFVAVLLVIGAFLGAFANELVLTSNPGALTSTFMASPIGFLRNHSWGTLIGAVLGGGIGFTMIVSALGPAMDANWLVKNGKPISASVREIEQKTRSRRVSSKGKSRREFYYTYFVVAEWYDLKHHRLHIFHSPEVKSYPDKLFPGCGIRIVIDPEDPGRYKMEF